MILAVPILGEGVEAYQVAALGFVVVDIYGLLYAARRKRTA